MIIREEYLITLNSKNKIQRVLLQLDNDPFTGVYHIYRITGQFAGKETSQPVIEIDKGKVKRTIAEQAALQYNSLLKNYLDKGYIKLSSKTQKKYEDCTESDLKSFLGGDTVSDQSGVPKPMLAKLADQCTADIWNKNWWVSRKLDGTRCLLYYKDGELHTASRGGGNYDAATTHIRTNPDILKIFNETPDLILDGELYHHGSDWPLQRISGLARQQEWKEECGQLEYWVYDYVGDDSFDNRWKKLTEFKSNLSETCPVKILEQKKMSGYSSIKAEHDKYVQEGFEGLCARNPDKEYGVNKRSAIYLIKLKERKDDEFEITGVREGMRPEDMCFTLKTKDGKEFAAKPIGDINTRLLYLQNKDSYIGKMATCTYFAISQDGIPTQPVFKHIRPEGE